MKTKITMGKKNKKTGCSENRNDGFKKCSQIVSKNVSKTSQLFQKMLENSILEKL